MACSLDLLGDKWTLLVVRDLLMGKRTYSELQASPEGIPTNILAERLKRLQAEGIVDRTRYRERPPRYAYHLTDKGRDLAPVLRSMVEWANKHVPGTLPLAEVEKLLKPGRQS
ncbi:MAG: winged helix-turn-helix transcriptional regulator [Thiogranum sp.]